MTKSITRVKTMICVTWPNVQELKNAQAATRTMGVPLSRFIREAVAQRLEQAAHDLDDPQLAEIAARHRLIRAYA